MSFDPRQHYLSVRSYTNPCVEILRDGAVVARFYGNTVDEAKGHARQYAKVNGIDVKEAG